MKADTSSAIDILNNLVAFKTISSLNNLAFIDYIKQYLASHGVDSFISYDETGERANIHGFVGPAVDGGVVLNGHSDVVPVEGQEWTSDPFQLAIRDERVYGRGAVDMKGFLACMLASVPVWQQKNLKRPIHISICYDEENGGFGAPVLVADLHGKVPRPAAAIIGEPTQMQIIAGHKGAVEMRTVFSGLEAHSSDPRKGVSAISYAVKLINYLEQLALEAAEEAEEAEEADENGSQSPFNPPFPTISIGTIHGGAARNIVAQHCALDWEIRPTNFAQGQDLMAKINKFVETQLLVDMKATFPDAGIEMITEANVPALDPERSQDAVGLIKTITGLNSCDVVSFGTDAGHFCNDGISSVVFGPGSIDQAHKRDEYIELSQIDACLAFLDKLGDHLER